jgi:hypothetical protein
MGARMPRSIPPPHTHLGGPGGVGSTSPRGVAQHCRPPPDLGRLEEQEPDGVQRSGPTLGGSRGVARQTLGGPGVVSDQMCAPRLLVFLLCFVITGACVVPPPLLCCNPYHLASVM